MKKLKRLVFVSLIGGLVFCSTTMAAETTITPSAVAINPFGSPKAGDYVVDAVDGAINQFNGAVSGCDGAGANCAQGWEFSYIAFAEFLDGSDAPGINSSTGLFQTPNLALTNALPVDYTATADLCCLDFVTPGLFDPNTIGFLTIDFLLQQILSTVTAPTLTGNDFLKLSFDPANEVLDNEALQPKFTDLDTQVLAAIKEIEAVTQQSIQLSDLDAMNSANDTDGYSALFKIGKDLIVGQVIGGDVNFALKTLMGEKTLYDLATELGKKGVGKLAEYALAEAAARGAANEIGSKIAAAAGAVVTVTEFGGKILIEMYKEVQVSNNQASIDVVHSKMYDRIAKAKAEAKEAFRGKNVDGLSTMSPLARDLLRQESKEPAINILKDIATTQKNIENSTSAGDKRILENHLAGLKERAPFLVNATIGKLVPGERGTEKG